MVDSAPGSAPVAAPSAPATPATETAASPSAAGDRRAATLAAMAAAKVGAPVTPAPVAIPAVETPADTTAAPAAATPVVAAPAVDDVPGMAALRKAEQHQRRQIAAERAQMQAEVAAERATWQQKLDAATSRDAALANARRDPLGALQALGFTEADFEPLGRTLYGASPAGKNDPKWRQAGEAALRERGVSTDVEKLQQKLDALEGRIASEKQEAAHVAELNRYADVVAKAVGDNTPFARAALAKAPDRARHQLLVIADRLYTESGPSPDLRDPPTPAEVLAAYEAERRAELEMYGIDPSTIHRPAAAPAPVAPVAPPTPPSPTIAPSGLTAPRSPAPDNRPSRDELLAGMAKLRASAG